MTLTASRGDHQHSIVRRQTAAGVQSYVGGHVAAQTFYDVHLPKLATAVGVTIKPINPKEMTLLYFKRVDELCRGGLQQDRQDYDVAEVIDLISNGVVTLRANEITTMIERAIEIGKRQGVRTWPDSLK
jgi:hypothetical protein